MITLKGTRTRKVEIYTCIQYCPLCGSEKVKVTRRYQKPRREAEKAFAAYLVKLGWTRKGKDYVCPKHTTKVSNDV